MLGALTERSLGAAGQVPALRRGQPDDLASNGGSCDRISLRRASVRRKITPTAPISEEYRKTAGGNDGPRTDGAAARLGTWSRRDRRARARTANPDRRTQGDGPRYTGNGRLCIKRG